MVIGKEVGSLLRPFSYCQVSCQKTLPSKQINTSLAIARFALRWIFALSYEWCLWNSVNRKTRWIHYQSSIDLDLLLSQNLTDKQALSETLVTLKMSDCGTENTFLKSLSTDGFQKYVLQQKLNQLYIESQNSVNCLCNFNCGLSGIVNLYLSNAIESSMLLFGQIFTMKFLIVSKFGFPHLCRKKFHLCFLNSSVLRNLSLIYTILLKSFHTRESRNIFLDYLLVWKHISLITLELWSNFLTSLWFAFRIFFRVFIRSSKLKNSCVWLH